MLGTFPLFSKHNQLPRVSPQVVVQEVYISLNKIFLKILHLSQPQRCKNVIWDELKLGN